MKTDPPASLTPGSATPSGCQDEAHAEELAEQLSTEELSRPACSISARLGRTFVGRTDYDGENALDAAIEEAKRALPQVSSAYMPTGKTSAMAVLLMIVAAPLVLLLLLGICGGLCWGWLRLISTISSDQSYGQSRLLGLLSLLLDLILVVLMVVIPTVSFGLLSKWFKNRNPMLPAILTGLLNLVVAIALFVPIWRGETLAPTHLTFLFIPIRWVLVALGGLVVPLVGAAVAYGKAAEQKFCEETACFLKEFGKTRIPFDLAENALALLRRGDHKAALRLPKLANAETKRKHWASISLWWREGAATAYLELNLRFHSKSKPQKKLTVEASKDKSKEWLAFSARLDRSQAEILAQEFRAPQF